MAVDRAVLLPGQELMEKLDKERDAPASKRWWDFEERIRREERGEQAEIPGGEGQQDPEYSRSELNDNDT